MQKTYECIDVLLNTAHMKWEELLAASNLILADNTSEIRILNLEDLIGHVYDLRSGQGNEILIKFMQTHETCKVSIGAVTKLFKEGRLANADLTIQGALVGIKAVKRETAVS